MAPERSASLLKLSYLRPLDARGRCITISRGTICVSTPGARLLVTAVLRSPASAGILTALFTEPFVRPNGRLVYLLTVSSGVRLCKAPSLSSLYLLPQSARVRAAQ